MINFKFKNKPINKITRVPYKFKQNILNGKIDKTDENSIIINEYNKINIPFLLKDSYDSIIPLNIYQTWFTKNLQPKMKENCENLQRINSEFSYYLYDDNDCYEFIKNNFDSNVLYAYNSLIPGAYKADLWRLCILYINGGIYLDIKFKCVNNFKLIAFTEKEFFLRDKNPVDVYNGLIISKPKNEILLKAIYKIVENVQNKNYGKNCLEPTGPHLLGNFFSQNEKNNMEICFDYTLIEGFFSDYYILYNNQIVLNYFKEYRDEQFKTQTIPHYSVCWVENNIYKN
jgi:mannosyltransferase OCH1-like enzyme